ncbi:MAG: hypothetical protein CVT98_09495 [Bacteroidetes bacterium HGW-Bacteroidetes-15]|nr:MAG: hypothetical protein CVT98_09495 [Bacteroidetes bacterium HGW-Bacteroidetes-15]
MLRVHFIRSTLILYILGLPLLSFGNPTKTSSLLEPIEKIPTATDSVSIQLSANLQSRHIWRGALTCDAWNVQPTINFSNKKFLVGAWGAYTIDNSYAEIDLYISYTIGNFTIALLDYFCPDETQRFNRLFDFHQSTTQHTLDLTLSFEGEKIPVRLMASTLIWGDDIDPTSGKNFYSTYFEAGYLWKRTPNQEFDIFLGATPFKGYYANSLNIVSAGIGINQRISLTDSFQFPIFGKLVINPYTENIFFVFGLSLGIK